MNKMNTAIRQETKRRTRHQTTLHSDDEITKKKNLDLCENHLFRMK